MCYKFKPGKFLMLHQQQKWFWIACIGIYLSLKETFVFFSAYQNFLKKIQRFGMCCEGLSHQYKRMDITSNLCSLILAGKLMLLFISEFSLVTAVVAISSIILICMIELPPLQNNGSQTFKDVHFFYLLSILILSVPVLCGYFLSKFPFYMILKFALVLWRDL